MSLIRISNIYYIKIRADLNIDSSISIFFYQINIVNFPFPDFFLEPVLY